MTASPSDPKGVQLKSKLSVYDGYLRVDRYRITHQLYGGGWSQALEREVMSRGAVAGVLLFDPTRQEVVLIEQFRTGAWAADWLDPWLLGVLLVSSNLAKNQKRLPSAKQSKRPGAPSPAWNL